MAPTGAEHVTQLLAAVADGREGAADELLSVVYDELRRLAHREADKVAPPDALPPTAVVHEAYVRLLGDNEPGWQDRQHFFRTAARAMRAIIVDAARERAALKRGGNRKRVPLHELAATEGMNPNDLLSLNTALTELQNEFKTSADVVMLRFFGGLTVEEAAAALDISTATVDRHWSFAKAWLRRELGEPTE